RLDVVLPYSLFSLHIGKHVDNSRYRAYHLDDLLSGTVYPRYKLMVGCKSAREVVGCVVSDYPALVYYHYPVAYRLNLGQDMRGKYYRVVFSELSDKRPY